MSGLRTARIALLVGMCLAACESDRPVPAGRWGGPNIELTVSVSGATASFKCGATGALSGPLLLDAADHFEVAGTYTPLLIRLGPLAATYTGNVGGAMMALSVRLTDGAIGPFQLTRGAAGAFEVCTFQ